MGRTKTNKNEEFIKKKKAELAITCGALPQALINTCEATRN